MSRFFFGWVNRRYHQLYICALFVCTLSLSVVLPACTPAPSSATSLKITGSSTVAPMMADIVRHYSIFNPNITVDVSAGGSNQGIEDVRQGESDIGMVSRSLTPEETELEAFTIARDGISLLIHQNNPITNLSKQQIIDIYTGKIDNWQAVNGPSAPIEVLSQNRNYATQSLFVDYFSLTADGIKADRLLEDNQAMMQSVVENPAAIGYVSIGAAEYKIIHGMPITLLPLEGIDATIRNVSNGTFPLSRPLKLITSPSPTNEQKKLIEFALSSEVKDIIQEKTFVPTVSH
ncbi:MAG: phosphate ABC transporter substrate-binding protein [Phormidesmis sp.]